MTGPFGAAANAYVAAGYKGIFWLDPRTKAPPPAGMTGAGGRTPSGADIYAWSEDHPNDNIGLRLPPDMIGIDEDRYDGKAGQATIAEACERYGELPGTWSITSRTDGSRIRLYRVPPGLYWPGEIGPGVEILQPKHRYAVLPPSIHPEGRTYVWLTPGGEGDVEAPRPDQFADLSPRWIEGLSGGRLAVDVAKAAPGDVDALGWYTNPANTAAPCGKVRTITARALAELAAGQAARHDGAMRPVMALVYMSAAGHLGAVGAIETVRGAWISAVTTGSSARSDEEAGREWQRLMFGALAVLAADGGLEASEAGDPCADWSAGLLLPEDAPAAYQPPPPPAAPGSPEAAAEADAQARLYAAEVARALRQMRVTADARTLHDAEKAERDWTEPPALHTLTEELALSDEPVQYLVDDIFPVGANVVLTAGFKAGKTTNVNDLVRCLVDDRPYLGRYRTHLPEGNVGIWNYEVEPAQYRAWLREVAIRNTDRVSLLNLRGHTAPLRSPRVQDWAVRWLIDRKIRVWVVDPFARAFLGSGQSENDNTEVGMFLETLDVIKQRAGVSELIMPVHTGRAAQEAGTERSRGATRVDDWADVRWLLTRDTEGQRFFRASGRDVETPEGTLHYDTLMRTLILHDDGGRTADAPLGGEGPLYETILAACLSNPGIGLRALRLFVRNTGLKSGNSKIDNATLALIQQGRIHITDGGPGVQRGHFAAPGTEATRG